MYGLIALFDETTEQLIQDIWRELKERSISFYAYEVEDRKRSFLNSGALFFSPNVTKELFEFHANHHKEFESFNENPHSLYLP
ncbi:hypothetical protein [Bacillus sp. NTK074B]|uniref:hypothetical protein n=1 Tax=Bacillus sp. NTK074B TaxID=2802174 RepID=UPI001FD6323A